MAELIDTTLKVICLAVFSRIVEIDSLETLLTFVNGVLVKARLPIPHNVVNNVNASYAVEFDKIKTMIRNITNELDFDSIPQLQYIEPKYADVIKGPSPRCITALAYSNKLNIELTSRLLTIVDKCMPNLEVVNCSIVYLPSGCIVNPHRSEYCGVITYIVAIEGSTLTHVKVNDKVMSLTTKASVFYDAISMTSFNNTGPTTTILLKVEVYRPFNFGLDAINWSTIQVIAESQELQYVCKMANM
jgi:hypothetical protein